MPMFLMGRLGREDAGPSHISGKAPVNLAMAKISPFGSSFQRHHSGFQARLCGCKERG